MLGRSGSVVAAPGAAATAFELLLERKKRDGFLSAQHVRNVAELYGRSEDTLWRWLRHGKPAGRTTETLDDAEVELLAACNGNVTLMHRELVKAGKARCSLRTYQRAVNMSTTPADRGFFADGDRGWRAKTIHMPQSADRRGERFHADHSLLKIWLRSKQRRRWVQVWLTVVIDAYSRLVVGWVVSLQPNEAVALTALRQAFTGEHGCIPDVMVWDNGAEWLGNAITLAGQALDFKAQPIAHYSPWQNGKVERFFETLESRFLMKQPFYMRGPRGRNGKLYGPNEGPLTVDEFVECLAEAIDEYNREHHHSELGRTPLEAWNDPQTVIQRVADERLLDFMLMRETTGRAISVYGVRHNNRWYYADELLAYKGDRIDVRFMPYDNRQIWLFNGEEFIAEAIPWESIDGRGRERFLNKRSATLVSARAKLPSRAEKNEEPQGSSYLPLTSPGDFVSGEPEQPASTPAEHELVDSLNEAAVAAGAVHAQRDNDDEADGFEDELDGVNEVIE